MPLMPAFDSFSAILFSLFPLFFLFDFRRPMLISLLRQSGTCGCAHEILHVVREASQPPPR